MTDEPSTPDAGWFADDEPGGVDAAARRIVAGRADAPRNWPALAVESGFAGSEPAYYERLHAAAVAAARAGVREREGADDRQLVHAVRAMDDNARYLT